jgi:hypothetical protein
MLLPFPEAQVYRKIDLQRGGRFPARDVTCPAFGGAEWARLARTRLVHILFNNASTA